MNSKEAVTYVCQQLFKKYGIKQDPEIWRRAKTNNAPVW